MHKAYVDQIPSELSFPSSRPRCVTKERACSQLQRDRTPTHTSDTYSFLHNDRKPSRPQTATALTIRCANATPRCTSSSHFPHYAVHDTEPAPTPFPLYFCPSSNASTNPHFPPTADRREFIKISQAVGMGFLIMGAIGYFIKLSTFTFTTQFPQKTTTTTTRTLTHLPSRQYTSPSTTYWWDSCAATSPLSALHHLISLRRYRL